MKTLMKKRFAPIVFTAMALPVMAAPSSHDGAENSAVKDAWLDGKLDTVILLNKHLNPFEINTDVENKIAMISGEVDSEVEKDLVTELAKGIEGIEKVENNLTIDAPEEKTTKDEGAMATLKDAAITTAISTKLLLNTEIDSTEIDVTTESKTVMLDGSVESDAERDLVEQIAKNTSAVESVKNNLTIVTQ